MSVTYDEYAVDCTVTLGRNVLNLTTKPHP